MSWAATSDVSRDAAMCSTIPLHSSPFYGRHDRMNVNRSIPRRGRLSAEGCRLPRDCHRGIRMQCAAYLSESPPLDPSWYRRAAHRNRASCWRRSRSRMGEFHRSSPLPMRWRLAGSILASCALDADDVAFLQYTGDNGVSKGATLSHGNLLANLEQCRSRRITLVEAKVIVTLASVSHFRAHVNCFCLSPTAAKHIGRQIRAM